MSTSLKQSIQYLCACEVIKKSTRHTKNIIHEQINLKCFIACRYKFKGAVCTDASSEIKHLPVQQKEKRKENDS